MRVCSFVKYMITLFMSIIVTFHILQYRSVPTYIKTEKTNIQNQIEVIRSNENLKVDMAIIPEKIKPGWTILPGNVTVHVGEEPVEYNVSYIINAEFFCKSLDSNRLSLVIFIGSTAENTLQRKAIRKSWALKAQQEAYNFRVIFFIGVSEGMQKKDILEESARYGDLVQMNFSESPQILGLKSYMGIRWCSEYCNNSDFYMKTDDDIIVHITNLLKTLKSVKDPQNLLLCHENSMRRILRPFSSSDTMPVKYSKYVVSERELPGTYYPPYCSGYAYVLSKDILKKLVLAAMVTPVFFIEDVYITGFVRHKAKVEMMGDKKLSIQIHPSFQQAVCDFKDGRITSQELDIYQMQKLWDEMNTQGFFCPKLIGFANYHHMHDKIRKIMSKKS